MKKSNKELARAEILDLLFLGRRMDMTISQFEMYRRKVCEIISKYHGVKIEMKQNLHIYIK